MTQQEAFAFLELPELASKTEIKLRLSEKLEYFEHLSEHAPSDFLRRINARHVDKVKHIQTEFFPWTAQENGLEVILPLEPAEAFIEEELFTEPLIIASGSGSQEDNSGAPQPAAFLILHTENKEQQHFPLHIGKTYLGRKAQPNMEPFIAIEDDPYISRVHAVVYVEEGKPTLCFLADTPEANLGKISANGTYLNGKPSRIVRKEELADGDTLQIGVSKLVFKYNTRSVRELLKEVGDSAYMPTVKVG
jgi:hypothetical protein